MNHLTFIIVGFTDGKRNVDHFTLTLTQAMTLQTTNQSNLLNLTSFQYISVFIATLSSC